MPYIYIRDSDQGDATTLVFPVHSDENISLDDLRSAFPHITSLRYTDGDEKKLFHVLCRHDQILEPEGGWTKNGRIYLAVCDKKGGSSLSRYGLFESYRKQLTSTINKKPLKEDHTKISESSSTMITVGHGHFKNGTFSRISANSLSGSGGTVVVGPICKKGNTAQEIKTAAFEKFKQLNKRFRQTYKRSEELVLLFPDGRIVENLPDGKEEFSILGYRNFLDPKKRFDRLRLYLCDKKDYNINQDLVELLSASSSDENLPSLSKPDENPSTDQPSDDDTLPLSIDVTYSYDENIVMETFPNNTKGCVLKEFIASKLNILPDKLLLKHNGILLTDSARLLEITSSTHIEINVLLEHIDTRVVEEIDLEESLLDKAIPANFDAQPDKTADFLVEKTLRKMEGSTEPTGMVRQLRKEFMRGRQLDLTSEDQTIDGDVSSICIRRHSIFTDSVTELAYVENIRFPLHITYVGENAVDYGGPRREFLGKFINEFEFNFIERDEDIFKITDKDEAIARHHYFYSGIIIGLSALEGGPAAPYLYPVLNSTDGEGKRQFISGLKRTGIYQLLMKTNTLKYIFMPRMNPLTVNRLIYLMKPAFSFEGSNRRRLEEEAYRNFVRYMRDVHAGRRAMISLDMILKFVTGSREEPVLGFAVEPSINFSDDATFPTANTCLCRLTLPIGIISDDDLDLAMVNDFFGYD